MATELFSKISRRMWRDQKFRSLSKPQPNARDLWIYLLSSPHNTAIPGLFAIGEAGLAEALDWDTESTRSCLQELIDNGMALVDRRSQLVWLPNALRHNMPQSPKNVLGWATAWRLLPECALLRQAATAIRGHLFTKNPRFAEAFDRVTGGDYTENCDECPPGSSGRRSADFQIGSQMPSEMPSVMASQEMEMEMEMSPTETFAAANAAAGPDPAERAGTGDQSADCSRADGPRTSHPTPNGPSDLTAHTPAVKPGKRPGGRRRDPGAPTPNQRYREAYEAGVRDASPGQSFALPPGKIDSLLGPVLGQHAKGPDGPLRGDALDAWIRRAVAEFRHAVDGSAQFWNGYGAMGFVRWLNSGRPRFASGARAVSPRVDDRPDVYGETREDFDRRQRDARELREAIARGDVVVDPTEIARREEDCPV